MTSKSKPMQMLRNINKEREKTNISKENADYFIKKYQKIQEKCTQKDDWVQLNCVLNIMLIACVADNECLEIGLAYSHKALDDLMPAINADTINPYTDLGQCQAQVIREATSNIAWYESQDINEQKRLEELLEIINLGCSYIYSDDDFWMYDSKVSILLKLNRYEEVYQIFDIVSNKLDVLSRYNYLKSSPDYLNWKSELANNNLTEEEIKFLKKAEQIHNNLSSESESKIKVDLVEKTPYRECLGCHAAFQKYDTYISSRNDDDNILIYEGDVQINKTLNSKWNKKQFEKLQLNGQLYGMLVIGNLTINGDLIVDDTFKLVVTGDLKCNNVIVQTTDPYVEMEIHGNAYIKNILIAENRLNSMSFEKNVYTSYFLGQKFLFSPPIPKKDFLYIEDMGEGFLSYSVRIGQQFDEKKGEWEYFEDSEKLLQEVVWDKNSRFSSRKFLSVIREGQNPFKTIKIQSAETLNLLREQAVLLYEQNNSKISKENAFYFCNKHQEIMAKCSSEEYLLYLTSLKNILDIAIDEENNCLEMGLIYCDKALEILKPAITSNLIADNSDLGQLQKEIIIEASNTLVWYELLKTDDLTQLEELLARVNLGCSYATEDEHVYIFDTKVRLLLKLKRNQQAYRLVLHLLWKIEDLEILDDIKITQEYLQWQSEISDAVEISKDSLLNDEIEFLEKAKKIHLNIINDITNHTPKNLTESIPTPQVMTNKEAKQKFNYSYKDQYFDDEDEKLFVFDGDLVINETMNKKWFEKTLNAIHPEGNLYCVLITGNLTINGDLIDVANLRLVVEGDLHCDYIFVNSNSLLIYGDANVRYGLYDEHYEEDCSCIFGELNTPYVLGAPNLFPNECNFIYIDGTAHANFDDIQILRSMDSACMGDWKYFQNNNFLIQPSVRTQSGEFSADEFFKLIRQGKNPFKILIS